MRFVKIAVVVAEWWIAVPAAGVAGLILCAILSASGFRCDTLGMFSLLASSTALLGFVEEPLHTR